MFLLDVPLSENIQHDPRSIAPTVDPTFLPDRAAYIFKMPRDLPPGVTVIAESSPDAQSWVSIATGTSSAGAQSNWEFTSPDQSTVSPSDDELETITTGLNQSYEDAPIGFFRLQVLLDSD